MGKGKKKHKKDELSEDILDIAALSVKKFRKVTKEIGKLSTGQKLVGGIALVAAGLTYLAQQENDSRESAGKSDDADTPLLSSGSDADSHRADRDEDDEPAVSSRKARKPSKPKHRSSTDS